MNALLTNFNFLLAFGDEKLLHSIDDAGRRQLLERIVLTAPGEGAWRALLELLASWPDNMAKEQAYDWLDGQLENWPDNIRAVNSSWTFIYSEEGKMSSIAKIVRSVTISHREQYGNSELKSILNTPEIRDIRTLVIHKSEIYLQGITALAHSPYLANLTTLALESLILSDEKFDILFAATNLSRLTRLRLKDVGLNTPRTERLLHSPLIRPVRDLELPFNDLDDQTAEILAASPKLQQLTTLHLQGNFIRAKGELTLKNKQSEDLLIILE